MQIFTLLDRVTDTALFYNGPQGLPVGLPKMVGFFGLKLFLQVFLSTVLTQQPYLEYHILTHATLLPVWCSSPMVLSDKNVLLCNFNCVMNTRIEAKKLTIILNEP